MTPPRRLYVVATVHLDTQWRWTVQDTIHRFLPATLERNFEILSKRPFFVVSFEGAFRYQLVQEYYPERFDELKRWVAAGRWRVAGSMLDAPDVNIVHPESLIRHILYGNGFFERELGVRSRDLFLPDCFGFGFALPSVAAHCGLEGFSAQKFGRWMAPATIPFDVGVWQGPDGSEVVAAIRPEGYGEGLHEDLSHAERFVERLDITGQQSGAYVGIKYVGVGDRGGGLDEASLDWLERSVESSGPVEVVVSGSDQIFIDLDQAQKAALPRYRGELLLPTHGTGCLTSQARLKRRNRACEQLADAAERAAVMAAWSTGLEYPSARLEEAWSRFLWHQMHDDLTGTSIPAAYRFTDNDQLLSLNQFAEILTQSVGAIAARLDTRGDGVPLVVFNPLSCEREDLVSVDLEPAELARGRPRITGPDGRGRATQVVEGDGNPAVLFLTRTPPLAVQVYHLQVDDSAAAISTDLEASATALVNRHYRVEIGADGDIHQIQDRARGRSLLSQPIRLQLLRDRSARWPAWEIRYEDLLATSPETVGAPAEVRVVEQGPVRAAVEVVRRTRRSTFRQVLRLAAEGAGERLEVWNEVDWASRGRLLKAAFPLAVSNPQATYDLGLGVIERGNNRRDKYEVPAQQWAAIHANDEAAGASILNDCRYGWDKPDDRTLRLSLLRSPRVVRKFRHQGRQDRGRHRFTYALYGHSVGWRPSDSTWQAARLNQPLRAFRTSTHAGDLGRELGFLSISDDRLALQALKRAERDGAIVARLRELAGDSVGPVSLRLPAAIRVAHVVNGMEDTVAPLDPDGERIRVESSPFAIQSLSFELSPPATNRSVIDQLQLPIDFDRVATRCQGHPDRRGFDGSGHSIPAELWPERLHFGGIDFALGAAASDRANALSCRGQTLGLPPHRCDRLHFLAASIEGTPTVRLRSAEREHRLMIGAFSCLTPNHPVAWVATHRHGPDGQDEAYVFCYLYRYSLVLEPDSDSLCLPSDPRVHLFAITLANDRLGDTLPAQPLYD